MPWQPVSVRFPDAELLMCDRTRPLLVDFGYEDDTAVVVGRSVPDVRPARLVVWNRDGGPTTSLRDRPRMRCRVFAPTDAAATTLANDVIALVPLLVDGAPVVFANCLSGPVEIPDATGPQRYLLFEIHTRGDQS